MGACPKSSVSYVNVTTCDHFLRGSLLMMKQELALTPLRKMWRKKWMTKQRKPKHSDQGFLTWGHRPPRSHERNSEDPWTRGEKRIVSSCSSTFNWIVTLSSPLTVGHKHRSIHSTCVLVTKTNYRCFRMISLLLQSAQSIAMKSQPWLGPLLTWCVNQEAHMLPCHEFVFNINFDDCISA